MSKSFWYTLQSVIGGMQLHPHGQTVLNQRTILGEHRSFVFNIVGFDLFGLYYKAEMKHVRQAMPDCPFPNYSIDPHILRNEHTPASPFFTTQAVTRSPSVRGIQSELPRLMCLCECATVCCIMTVLSFMDRLRQAVDVSISICSVCTPEIKKW